MDDRPGTLTRPPDAPASAPRRSGQQWLPRWYEMLAVGIFAALVLQPTLPTSPAVETWATIFVSITVQALPFLVLGVLVSGAITAFVPATFFARALPTNRALAVPVAGTAGLLLPGCECGSVPVASGLLARGVTPAAAFTFLLSAPAINPIVLVATAVAFPGQPEVVLARFVASLATAVVLGLLWVRFGDERWLRSTTREHSSTGPRWATFLDTGRHDFLHAGGFLVIGALLAATLNVVVPRGLYEAVAGDPVLSVVALSALAVLMSICSEADAFVAASLRSSPPPRSSPSWSSARWST